MPCTASRKRRARSWKKEALRADRQGEPGGTVPPAAALLGGTPAAVCARARAGRVRHRAWASGTAAAAGDGGGGREVGVAGAFPGVPAGTPGTGEEDGQRATGSGLWDHQLAHGVSGPGAVAG